MNKIVDTKFLYVITGEILDKVSGAELKDFIIVDFDKKDNLLLVCKESEYYQYLAFTNSKEISIDDYLSNCKACGGNWVSMLLSGMKKLYPEVWEAIPDDETFSFSKLCKLLKLCGVVFD
jgi:hypothetical protein